MTCLISYWSAELHLIEDFDVDWEFLAAHQCAWHVRHNEEILIDSQRLSSGHAQSVLARQAEAVQVSDRIWSIHFMKLDSL